MIGSILNLFSSETPASVNVGEDELNKSEIVENTVIESELPGVSEDAIEKEEESGPSFSDRFTRFLDNTTQSLFSLDEQSALAAEISSTASTEDELEASALISTIQGVMKESRPFYFSSLSTDQISEVALKLDEKLRQKGITKENPLQSEEALKIIQETLLELDPGLYVEAKAAYLFTAAPGLVVGAISGFGTGLVDGILKGAEYGHSVVQDLKMPASVLLSSAIGAYLGYSYNLDVTNPMLVGSSCLAVIASSFLINTPTGMALDYAAGAVGGLIGMATNSFYESFREAKRGADLTGKAGIAFISPLLKVATFPIRLFV